MTVESAAGAMKIKVRADSMGDPWIHVNGRDEGCFTNTAIENLINELADAIGKIVTLSDKPEPIPELPKAIGSVIYPARAASDKDRFYIRIGSDSWVYVLNGKIGTGAPYSDAGMTGSWLGYAKIIEGDSR